MTISILGVDNVILAVGDLREARSFYEGVLGLRVKFADDEHGILGFAIGEEEPGLVIRAQTIEKCEPRQTPRVWLEVPDARAAAPRSRPWGSRSSGRRSMSARAGPSSSRIRGGMFSV